MSDVAKWKLRGPVRTLRSESAEWDAAQEAWKPPRHFKTVTFMPDGKINVSDFHNPDGSIFRSSFRYDERGRLIERQSGTVDKSVGKSLYHYDEQGRHVRTVSVEPDGTARDAETCRYDSTGRKTKVSFLSMPPGGMPMVAAIEKTETSFGAPGATTMTTTYGEGDRPLEVVLHDANHAVVRRFTFTRDREGRVLSEEMQFGASFPLPELGEKVGEVSAEDAAKLAAMLTQVFAKQTMHSTTYAYDRHGRVLERITRMGVLSETRTTYTYDDRDNPIEEITDDRTRGVGAADDGTLRGGPEDIRSHSARFEYRYDAEGNWTERIVSSSPTTGAPFKRSNIERREITYYGR